MAKRKTILELQLEFYIFSFYILAIIIPYIICYNIKVKRQSKCFPENLLTRETTQYIYNVEGENMLSTSPDSRKSGSVIIFSIPDFFLSSAKKPIKLLNILE